MSIAFYELEQEVVRVYLEEVAGCHRRGGRRQAAL
jgi:hypothetical protein